MDIFHGIVHKKLEINPVHCKNHSELETTARYAHLAPDAGMNEVMGLWG